MSSNAERAERGRTALAAYRQARGEIDELSYNQHVQYDVQYDL